VEQRAIVITEADFAKLQSLVSAYRRSARDLHHLADLEQELERATVLPGKATPNNVVVMNSRVSITDVATGEMLQYEIVFPREADISKGKISVLAPIGTALLGYQTGAIVEWSVPKGKRTLRINQVATSVAA
jgi:regulator of nucleoside diphosphate kinase